MKVSLIITTKNEEGCIGRLLSEVPRNLVDQIIVVDGDSADKTAKEAKQFLKSKNDKFVVQKKKGFGNAVIQGIEAAKGEVSIIMCGDGSDDPKYIKVLLEKIDAGYGYVRASRYMKGGKTDDDTMITFVGNKIFTFLTNLVHGLNVSDALYIYSVVRKDALKKMKLTSPGFEITLELLIKSHKSNLTFTNVPVHERKRFAGKPKINSFKDGLKMFKMIFRKYH